jgi:microcompartment protein CcmK/EutM
MLLGRIIGNVVCTMKDPALVGQKLLIVQPLDRKGRDKGRPVVALDAVGAGAGETIYCAAARKPAFRFNPSISPRKPRSSGSSIP